MSYAVKGTRTIRRQFRNGRKQYKHTPETNKKIARAKFGDKNPMRRYPVLREKSRHVMLKTIQKRNMPPTDIERILTQSLNEIGIRYQPNRIVRQITIPDAFIPSLRVAIYADGSYWHGMPKRVSLDKWQDEMLDTYDYKVLRFSDKEIKASKFTAVLKDKLEEIKTKRALELPFFRPEIMASEFQ